MLQRFTPVMDGHREGPGLKSVGNNTIDRNPGMGLAVRRFKKAVVVE